MLPLANFKQCASWC